MFDQAFLATRAVVQLIITHVAPCMASLIRTLLKYISYLDSVQRFGIKLKSHFFLQPLPFEFILDMFINVPKPGSPRLRTGSLLTNTYIEPLILNLFSLTLYHLSLGISHEMELNSLAETIHPICWHVATRSATIGYQKKCSIRRIRSITF